MTHTNTLSRRSVTAGLAMYFDGGGHRLDADIEGTFDEIEAAALASIYRQAVAECGFNPIKELELARKTSKQAGYWVEDAA